MVKLMSADWLESQLAFPAFQLVDPRRAVKYLQGHIRTAVNVPVLKAFDAGLRLLDEDRLAQWLGNCGISRTELVVVYDDYDGQNASMLAWVLEYLGHRDVRLLDVSFGKWRESGREVFYKPVLPNGVPFVPKLRPEVRAVVDDVALSGSSVSILDVRSPEEFDGKKANGSRPGHIPGAKNIPWLNFVSKDDCLFVPEHQIHEAMKTSGLDPSRQLVVYCQMGMRAAVAHIALEKMGYDVKLYDGSYAEWSGRPDLPVESALDRSDAP